MELLVLTGPTVFTAPRNSRAAKTVIVGKYRENAGKVSKKSAFSVIPLCLSDFHRAPAYKNDFLGKRKESYENMGSPP